MYRKTMKKMHKQNRHRHKEKFSTQKYKYISKKHKKKRRKKIVNISDSSRSKKSTYSKSEPSYTSPIKPLATILFFVAFSQILDAHRVDCIDLGLSNFNSNPNEWYDRMRERDKARFEAADRHNYQLGRALAESKKRLDFRPSGSPYEQQMAQYDEVKRQIDVTWQHSQEDSAYWRKQQQIKTKNKEKELFKEEKKSWSPFKFFQFQNQPQPQAQPAPQQQLKTTSNTKNTVVSSTIVDAYNWIKHKYANEKRWKDHVKKITNFWRKT